MCELCRMNDPSWEWPAPPPSPHPLPRLAPRPTVRRLSREGEQQGDADKIIAHVKDVLREYEGKTVTPELQAELTERTVAALTALRCELPSSPTFVAVTMGADGETVTATFSLPAWWFDQDDEGVPPKTEEIL